jgi:hypothetical protein
VRFFVFIFLLGVLQNYFEQDEQFAGTPNLSFQLTFVITICNVLMNVLAPVGQLLLAIMEARTVLFISIVFCSIGLLLASFSTEVRDFCKSTSCFYDITRILIVMILCPSISISFIKELNFY